MQDTERNSWENARSSFKEEQRRSIVGAALALLMEEGAPGLTMAGLADRAGISRQTLYRYFPDLDSVLAASVDGLAEADAQFRESILRDGEPRDQLHRAIDALIDAAAHGSGRLDEFLAALPPEARAAFQAHRRRTMNLLGDILSTARSQRHSTYRGDPTVDAELILGLVSASDQPPRERIHHIVDFILLNPTSTTPTAQGQENPS